MVGGVSLSVVCARERVKETRLSRSGKYGRLDQVCVLLPGGALLSQSEPESKLYWWRRWCCGSPPLPLAGPLSLSSVYLATQALGATPPLAFCHRPILSFLGRAHCFFLGLSQNRTACLCYARPERGGGGAGQADRFSVREAKRGHNEHSPGRRDLIGSLAGDRCRADAIYSCMPAVLSYILRSDRGHLFEEDDIRSSPINRH